MKMRNIPELVFKLKKLILFKFQFPINVMLRFNLAFVLNKFRLAFQVFLKPEGDQGPTIVVKDVAVSQVVADSKACGDLKIVKEQRE